MADSGTVKVNLKRDWFGPDGSLYEVRGNPHEFPTEWADEPADDAPKGAKYAVLPSTAEIVKEGKTVAVLQNTAAGQVVVPTAIEGDVKSVGGALDEKGNEKPSQSVAAAAKGAEEENVQLGGRPRESGPLPPGTKKPA